MNLFLVTFYHTSLGREGSATMLYGLRFEVKKPKNAEKKKKKHDRIDFFVPATFHSVLCDPKITESN